jgi:hypothetical protein
MRYNDRAALGAHRPETPDTTLQTFPEDTFVLSLAQTDGQWGTEVWLTPEAAVELAGELDEWVRSLDK